MDSKYLYRLGAFLKHRLTSWNTGGEGIHSPYLFYIVRMLMYDRNPYYSWERIESRRTAMLHAPKLIQTQDFGTGTSSSKLVCDIAKRELEKRRNAEFLFRLVSFLGHEKGQPLNIVELGTSLGITTAYLAMADSRNKVYTFEGSKETLEVAESNWRHLEISNIVPLLGNIDDTLYNYARERTTGSSSIDFAFLDANHTEEATLRYFDILAQQAGDKSIFVFDDIHYSKGMARAWERIKQDARVTTTMDCFDFGIVFFDPHYLRRNYTLRL